MTYSPWTGIQQTNFCLSVRNVLCLRNATPTPSQQNPTEAYGQECDSTQTASASNGYRKNQEDKNSNDPTRLEQTTQQIAPQLESPSRNNRRTRRISMPRHNARRHKVPRQRDRMRPHREHSRRRNARHRQPSMAVPMAPQTQDIKGITRSQNRGVNVAKARNTSGVQMNPKGYGCQPHPGLLDNVEVLLAALCTISKPLSRAREATVF